FFFFNDTATTEIYTLSLHDALPISRPRAPAARPRTRRPDEDRARQRAGQRRRPARKDPWRPDRPAGGQPRLRQLGGADEPVACGGGRGGGSPAASGPRRPGRDPEIRAPRRPRHP